MSPSNDGSPTGRGSVIPPGNQQRPASIGWMAELGLKEGEWFHASKPALKAGMRPTFELKARVWCCGRLHAESHHSELAMGMFRGKKIPQSPAAIAQELHQVALAFYVEAGKELTDEEKKTLKVSRQNVRRTLAELEQEGVAERRTEDGILLRDLSREQLKRLPIGKIRLFFFARPRPAKRVPDVVKRDYVSFPFLSPSEGRLFSRLLRRFGLDPRRYVASDGYVQKAVKVGLADYQQADSVARADYEKAENVAAEALKESLDVAAASERIVSNPVSNLVRKGASGSAPASSSGSGAIGDNPSSSSAFPLVSREAPPVRARKAEEEDSRSLYQVFKAEYPAGHFDEPKTKPSFEKKTKTQQLRVIERLHVYLDCERWKDEDGQWIPFSSKWLETYEADPPPAFKRKAPRNKAAETFDQAFEAGGD